MKQFAQLFIDLDASTSTLQKNRHLVQYFEQAPTVDAAWAVYFLCGAKPKRVLATRVLRQAACAMANIPDWLFEECYQALGDLAETIAYILPPPQAQVSYSLAVWLEQYVLPLRQLSQEQALQEIQNHWPSLQAIERFLFVKLIGGGFRVGVSRVLVTRALAEFAGVDAKTMAQRLMGYTEATTLPSAASFTALLQPDPCMGALHNQIVAGQPYPFFLAHTLPTPVDFTDLGEPQNWLAQWKYDGVRIQVVRTLDRVFVWSRGEVLLNDAFPEILEIGENWPSNTILDGELLAVEGKQLASFASFASLQERLGRKRVDVQLRQRIPVVFMAYDFLQLQGQDLRQLPQYQRQQQLLVFAKKQEHPRFRVAPELSFDSWLALEQLRAQARGLGVEGVMLKQRTACYGVGRTRSDGVWLKWKLEPMTVDAVLVYAQRGHGRRAGLFTDYTFAVWEYTPTAEQAQAVCQAIAEGKTLAQRSALGLPALVTCAKAYSGLTDQALKQVDAEIKLRCVDQFGPVRTVVPWLVFELGFEGISWSKRHKSGVALRFPRILRLRPEKPLFEANTVADLQGYLRAAIV